MKKKTLGVVLAIVAVIQVAAIVIIFVAAPRKHEGRTAAQWAVSLRSLDDEIRLRAVAELVLAGADAVPMLVELLEPPGIVDLLLDPEVVDYWEVLPLSSSVEQAARAIGEDAVDPLIRIFGDGDPASREAAVRILSWVGVGTGRARQAIVEALGDGEAGVRRAAACALGGMGAGSATEREALRGCLDDPDLDVRVRAAGALWWMTGKADGLLAPLIEDLMRPGGPSWYWVLEEMGEAAAPAVNDLARALSHTNQVTRAVAVRVLVELGPAAVPAIPALRRMLAGARESDEHEIIRRGAELALAIASPEDPVSRGFLLQRIYAGGSRRAALILWKTGVERERVLKVLLWPRGSEPPLLPEIIGDFGLSAVKATPYLIRVLRPEEGDEPAPVETTLAAVLTLGLIGPPAVAARPVLTKLMRDAEGILEPEAALAVYRITGESTEALRVICAVVLRPGRRDDAPRIAAVRALAVMARTIPAVEDRLLRLVHDESPAVREAAQEGLDRLRRMPSR
jgi:HEAT repeat protein